MFLLQVFSPKIYMDFQKDIVKWQHLVVNCQRLSAQSITNTSETTNPLAIQNTFCMSHLDNFSQWNKLHIKRQPKNPNDIKF